MKTRDELVLDFMLQISCCIQEDICQIDEEPEWADRYADCVLAMAQTLARKYLESL
jgi:hypothetical protein